MENIQTSIFKAYDFRGIYPSEIDADVMERMGRAFAIFANSPKILVGYDMRVSAPETSVAFIKGVTLSLLNMFAIPFFCGVIVFLEVYDLFTFDFFSIIFFRFKYFLFYPFFLPFFFSYLMIVSRRHYV